MRRDGLAASDSSTTWREWVLGRPAGSNAGVMVALVQTFVALELALWSWNSPLGTGAQAVDATVAVVLACAAALSLALGRRAGRRWPFVMLALTSVAVLLGVATRLSPQGQLLLGADLLLVAVVAACLVDPAWFLALLVPSVAAFLAITLARGLTRPFFPLMLSVTVVAVSLLVEALVRSLQDAALLDPLTGALNRRGLAAEAGTVRGLMERAGEPTAVVIIDVDRFKRYNDERGHAAGDAVLAGLTASWRGHLREGDLLARTGGDEFVLVLPGSAHRDTDAVVQRLREASDVPWSHGSAAWQADASFDEVLAQADAELMDAKARRAASD